MRALVVGAHDDDAVAWMAGTILRLSDWGWTVVSLCHWCGRETGRQYFQAAADALNFRGICSNFIDDQGQRRNDVQQMMRAVGKATEGQTFDYIFTHSRAPGGEYGGHCNHDEAREATIALVRDGKLTPTPHNIVYFAYTSCQPDPNAPFYVDLTPEELRIKKDLLASQVIRGDMEGLGLWDEERGEVRCANQAGR